MIENKCLNLGALAQDFCPGITDSFGAYMAEAASVCFDSHGHPIDVLLSVAGRFLNTYSVKFFSVNDKMKRSHNDHEVATEYGAYGIAILIIDKNTEFTVIERSRKGTGFDFWLGDKQVVGPYFQNKARLEVSGIRNGTDLHIETRLKGKLEQTKRSDGLLPAYIAIVEFGTPKVKVVEK